MVNDVVGLEGYFGVEMGSIGLTIHRHRYSYQNPTPGHRGYTSTLPYVELTM